MSDQSTNLQLPFLAGGQAQKHVTINESLLRLDALVQLSVVSATTTTEPASPSDGQLYILPVGKIGTHWGAMTNWALAYFRDGVWEQISPREGFIAFVKDTDALAYYTGAGWTTLSAFVSFSATDRVLGRVSSGSGAAEEVVFTDQAQQLCDDTSFSAMRATLGAIAKGGDTSISPLGIRSSSIVTGCGLDVRRADNTDGPALAFGSSTYCMGRLGEDSSMNRVFVANEYGSGTRLISLYPAGAAGAVAFRVDSAAKSYFGGEAAPLADNSYDLGSASFRWAVVRAGTGTINTSDAREKTAMQPIPDSVKRAVRSVIAGVGVFQWLSRVDEKGADGARLHVGVSAQAVRDAFAAEGEDAARWALFCEDPVLEEIEVDDVREVDGKLEVAKRLESRQVRDREGNALTRLGLRTDQLFALALAVLFEALPA